MFRNRGAVTLVALLVGGCAVALVGPVGPAGATDVSTAPPATNHTSPTLDVTVDGDPVTDGDEIVVRGDGRLSLRSSVPAENVSISTVLIRVDGETVHRASDVGTSLDLNRTLPLASGNNTVRILVEGSNEAVASMRFRAYLETVPPALGLTGPIETSLSPYQYPDVEVNATRVTLAGEFSDVTGVDRATMTHTRPADTVTFDTLAVDGPDARFEWPLLLHYGVNRIEVATRDTLGNPYYGSFDVRVVDPEPPELTLDYRATDSVSDRYTVTGTATDSVWVENVTVSVLHVNNGPFEPDQSRYVAVSDRRYVRSTDRLNVSFEQSVRLLEGRNYVSVRAYDHKGQRVVAGYWVEYYPETQRPPTISLDWNRTEIRDNETLDVNALVADDDRDLDRVLVEVTNLDTDEVTDLETRDTVRNDSVLIDRPLRISAGVNRVLVRAFDDAGNASELTFFVDTAGDDPTEDPPSGYAAGDDSTDGDTPVDSGVTADPTDDDSSNEENTATASAAGGAETTDEANRAGGLPDVPIQAIATGVVGVFGVGYLWYRRLTRV